MPNYLENFDVVNKNLMKISVVKHHETHPEMCDLVGLLVGLGGWHFGELKGQDRSYPQTLPD